MLDFLYWKVLSSSWKVSLVRSGEVNLLPILLIDEVNQGSTLWWWVRWLRMYEVTLLQPSTRQQLSDSLSNLPVLTFLYSPWHLLLLIATDRNVPTRSGVICPLQVCIWRWCLRLAFFLWQTGHGCLTWWSRFLVSFLSPSFTGGGFFFGLGSSSSLLWHGGCFLFLPFFAGLSSSSVGGQFVSTSSSSFTSSVSFLGMYSVFCILGHCNCYSCIDYKSLLSRWPFLRSWWFCFFCILCPWCLSVFFPVMD